ncbi:hypothetical protein ZW61_003230 [Salmonella enterica subsp. houtenae]|uniref:Uncharacterized protein n=1 Tax=Salmonella enterica subsp. enterica serovar Napoli TaxID=1151001 RepID=A0A5I0S3L3_SALET|nr:hypothetical protein [Salmonella enterica subsp. enterica serovar Napoli]EAN0771953.1 hypothetical protein [Salmonella enterica]EBU9231305.1 hypothetical protein [Salmonella enterica subsp. enterica serovar Ndolo]ECD9546568.1 hypothetical protein [Salmonella enterica subsp. houtenae]ECL2126335.1 hypothetical protein [Salmonella enterica subsp. enterica serovar Veneziana]EDV0404515.1 hypothetical protein [Salmonella enterica subsp. enterica]
MEKKGNFVNLIFLSYQAVSYIKFQKNVAMTMMTAVEEARGQLYHRKLKNLTIYKVMQEMSCRCYMHAYL